MQIFKNQVSGSETKINGIKEYKKIFESVREKNNLGISKAKKISIKTARENILFHRKKLKCQKCSLHPLIYSYKKTAFGSAGGLWLDTHRRLTTVMNNSSILLERNKVTKSCYVNSIYIYSIIPGQ